MVDCYQPPFETEQYYHIYHHANGGNDLFREQDNYPSF